MRNGIKRTSGVIFIIITMLFVLAGCGKPSEVATGTNSAVTNEATGTNIDSADSTGEIAAADETKESVDPAGENTATDEAKVSENSAGESATNETKVSENPAGNNNKDETKTSEEKPSTFRTAVSLIKKHGNIILDLTIDEIKEKGIDVGDILAVRAGDREFVVPVCKEFNDVDTGSMVCRFDSEDNSIDLAVNMGSFAEETGIGKKIKTGSGDDFQWDILIPTLEISVKEKGGFQSEHEAGTLERTNARDDYPQLSDEEFANFRAVKVTGMKENVLYRSSSPIRDKIGRNEYAMAAMEKAGIRTVINLDDSAEDMVKNKAYPGSYYSTCRVINPEMNYEFETEEFGEKVKAAILFMIENEPPYLIHCLEGKDRTGILCAILECFAGASADEVKTDYMITYYNFYNVKSEDDAYSTFLKNNLEKTLGKLLKLTNLNSGNLQESAEKYLLSTGLTEEQLEDLKEVLGK